MSQHSLFTPAALSVTEITRYLHELFESDDILHDVWVQGEISNLSRPSSGHLYFTLKDSTAALRCVIWRSAAQRLRLPLQNGLAVEAHGAVNIYERDGVYQLYIDALRPAGEGQLYQQFLRLKARLEAEGLFDLERKRPLPERPAFIGIITSSTGAALQDMLNTFRTRYPLAQVILAPTSVQGETAPAEIVSAVQQLNSLEQLDVILMARGGGSLEDLWAFNDERVVRAIAGSRVPIITGIGHETDFTLADFAADARAPTPTAAAMMATPEKDKIEEEISTATYWLNYHLNTILEKRRSALKDTHLRLLRLSPLWRIQNNRQHLDDINRQMLTALIYSLRLRHSGWLGMTQRLEALNPLSVLQRGYAVLSRANGNIVHSVAQVSADDRIHARLADGALVTRVEKILKAEGKETS